jgi:hypothetical protein
VSHRAYKQQQAVAADVAALPLEESCDQVAALAADRLEAAVVHHDGAAAQGPTSSAGGRLRLAVDAACIAFKEPLSEIG